MTLCVEYCKTQRCRSDSYVFEMCLALVAASALVCKLGSENFGGVKNIFIDICDLNSVVSVLIFHLRLRGVYRDLKREVSV